MIGAPYTLVKELQGTWSRTRAGRERFPPFSGIYKVKDNKRMNRSSTQMPVEERSHPYIPLPRQLLDVSHRIRCPVRKCSLSGRQCSETSTISLNRFIYIFLPPVTCSLQLSLPVQARKGELTIIVWPLTYENKGLATAKIALAASVAVPGLLRGMSAYALVPAASFRAFGIPRGILLPSGVVTKTPSSLAAVRRVRMWPNATL